MASVRVPAWRCCWECRGPNHHYGLSSESPARRTSRSIKCDCSTRAAEDPITVHIGIDWSQAQPGVCFLDTVLKRRRGWWRAPPIVTERRAFWRQVLCLSSLFIGALGSILRWVSVVRERDAGRRHSLSNMRWLFANKLRVLHLWPRGPHTPPHDHASIPWLWDERAGFDTNYIVAIALFGFDVNERRPFP